MKKLLFLLISVCCVTHLIAQENDKLSFFDSLSFGIKAGTTISTTQSGSAGLENEQKDGGRTQVSYHFGALTELRITKHLSFQLEAIYSNEKSQTTKKDEMYEASYIQIPLLVKFYFAKGFSIEAGPQVGYLLSSEITFDEDINSRSPVIIDELPKTDFRFTTGLSYRFNNGIFFGGRYDFYITDPEKLDREDDGSFLVSHSKFRNGLIDAFIGYMF